MNALDRYRELVGKVDGFFARVEGRHGAEMNCGSGCHDCCHVRFSVTGVEAAILRAALAESPPEVRARLAERAALDEPDRCAALGDDGRCSVYASRPLVCRSHGVPIRQRAPNGAALIGGCFRNFTERGPSAVDADCVLDQATLSTVLLAIDSAHAAETGAEPGTRIAMATLLLEQ